MSHSEILRQLQENGSCEIMTHAGPFTIHPEDVIVTVTPAPGWIIDKHARHGHIDVWVMHR